MISSESIKGLQKVDAEQFCRILNAYDFVNDLTAKDIEDLTAMYFRSKFVVTKPYCIYHLDVAEILLLLRNGKGIQLSATIPQEGKKSVSINQDMNHELQKMLVDSLLRRFPTMGRELEDEHILSDLCERKYQLVQEHEKESRQKKFTKKLGGFIVRSMSNLYFQPEIFQKINKSKFYALCADFLFYNEQLSSIFNLEDWESNDIKEKYDFARKWVDSYHKQQKNKGLK